MLALLQIIAWTSFYILAMLESDMLSSSKKLLESLIDISLMSKSKRKYYADFIYQNSVPFHVWLFLFR